MTTNEKSFSQAQVNFLEFIRDAFREETSPFFEGKGCLDLAYMKDRISGEKMVFIALDSRDVRLEKGVLTSIYFEWIEKGCYVHQRIRLHEPYFDEEIYAGEHRDGTPYYGEMIRDDSISLGLLTWVQAARILYQMIGIPEEADRARFVKLVKAL